MTEIPEHLRPISLGEEIESTSYEEIDRNRNFIPQVDGTMDSRDSLDQTLDSIDLTKSPVKHTNTQKHIEKITEDTSDDDTDEMIDFDKDKARKIYRKDCEIQKDRTTKICYKYRKKEIIKTKKRKSMTECKR